MKTKWQASQVRAAQQWLAETWPALFTPGRDLIPLTIKIHKDILQHPGRPDGVSRRAIVEALSRHTGSFGYLFGMTKHTHRVDLSLQPTELVSEQHKAGAVKALRRQQKIAQAAKRKSAPGPGRSLAAPRPRTVTPKVATQITYKKQRRRLVVKPLAARTPTPGIEPVAA
ncbi:MAG: ProQ/FinO family protein [Pseudomonadota bacterium]